jgi:hypothetical protein
MVLKSGLSILFEYYAQDIIFKGTLRMIQPFNRMSPKCRMLLFGTLFIQVALHTMAFGEEDKGFQQFDWRRVKVCPLSLHTRDQWPPKCLHGNTFCEFWC